MAKKEQLGFCYERKRIKREIKLPVLCKDYKPVSYSDCCDKAKLCKNATYSTEGKASGVCFGGTQDSEREDRKIRLKKTK